MELKKLLYPIVWIGLGSLNKTANVIGGPLIESDPDCDKIQTTNYNYVITLNTHAVQSKESRHNLDELETTKVIEIVFS